MTSDLEIVSPLTHESWVESDEEDSEEEAVDSTTSMFSQLEQTRADLEDQLGVGPLLQAYHLIQTLQEEGEVVEEFPMDELTAIIGPHNAEHCPTLIHLTLADSAYTLLATPSCQLNSDEDVGRVKVEVEVEG
jgi:hypothetical protein